MKVNRYYLSAIATFFVFGFISLPIKALHGYASNQILFYRVTFALLCLLCIIGIFRRKSGMNTVQQYRVAPPAEKRKFISCALLGSLFLTVNWLSFIYAINHISVQAGSFAYLVCPILTSLLGFLLLKERLKLPQWIALAICVLACGLVGVDSVRNLLFSLFIALSYAFYLITQRILREYDRIVLLAMQIGLAFVILLCMGSDFRGKMPEEGYFYANIFVLSSMFTVLPLFLNAFSLKGLPASTMGALMYLNPLINFALAFWYYGEKATSSQWLAYSLILVSVLIYNIRWEKWLVQERKVSA